MRLRNLLVAALVLALASVPASAAKHPRYIFELPNGYIGWIQVIFNDPAAPRLSIVDRGVLIDVPETGIVRTSSLWVFSSLAPDEFYYKGSSAPANTNGVSLPNDYVLPGITHGGFSVMDTGGRGKGYSLFIFIGPPKLRKNIPLADSDAVVRDWRAQHGNPRVPAPDPYPTPGRIIPKTVP